MADPRRAFLTVVGVLFALTVLVPPWHEFRADFWDKPRAYAILFAPPRPGYGSVRVDFDRLALEWLALGVCAGLAWLFIRDKTQVSQASDASVTSVTGASTSPGWYPDPYRVHALREWDGACWTALVKDGDTILYDPIPSTQVRPLPQDDVQAVDR